MKLFGGLRRQKGHAQTATLPQVGTPPADMGAAHAAFLQAYPTFAETRVLDDLRATEYARLDKLGQIYLDYTGGGLYAAHQLRAHMDLLNEHVFGNPHSVNPTSRAMTELTERARAFVLEYFHAAPEEYLVAFTPNASGALKLVGESYPFAPGGQFLITYDNHNSVNGIREFAHAKGANCTYLPLMPPDLRLDAAQVSDLLAQPGQSAARLFAYPAQSNFSGVQHDLAWIDVAHQHGWDVLLDAAAFAPTNRLDLSRWHPDFVPLSFYKIFGYPTGVGCLLARKAAIKKLRRPWFAGGTIWSASVGSEKHVMLENEAAFEDGTINYLSLPAVEIGLRYIQSIGIEKIHTRVMCLTGWLLDALQALQHSNGAPLAQIYGPRDTHQRGGTIALNFLDPEGKIVDERVVDARAGAQQISLRTGCFCNPGAGEAAFSITPNEIDGIFHRGSLPLYDDLLAALGLQSGGAVRVSLGLATTFADVFRFIEFAHSFQDSSPDASAMPAREHC
jgi:molybdenum cofactor sulfurtransferase